MDLRNWLTLAFVFVFLVLFIRFYGLSHVNPSFDWVHFIARVAIFGAISTILYIVPIFKIRLFFLPSFLELHFDEIPAFIAGFAYGPWTGLAVILIKTLIKLPLSSTFGVGELADLLFSSAFVLPAVFIYQRKRNLKGVALGFAVSSLCQLVVSMVLNVYMMLPFYMAVAGFSLQAIINACQAANPLLFTSGAIAALGPSWAYAFFAVLPLNVIKDAAVIIVTFLVYRSIHKLLHFDQKKAR